LNVHSSHTCGIAPSIRCLPAGFVIPAQAARALKPPCGADWVSTSDVMATQLSSAGTVPTVRLYSRNAYDWTIRLPAIAAAAELIEATSFTIDGEAVVLGPDGV
jgi:bifunctional non-homologous end joining protein LigD